MCQAPVFDFEATTNSEVAHAFVLQNEGDAPIRVERVRTGCGCSHATLSEDIVAPGRTVTVDVTISLVGRKGGQRVSTYVHSDDPAQPILQLQCIGIARQAGEPVTATAGADRAAAVARQETTAATVPSPIGIQGEAGPSGRSVVAKAGVAPLGPTLKTKRSPRNVVLPPLASATVDALKREDSSKAVHRLRIGVGRLLDPALVVERGTTPASEWEVLPSGWRVWSVDLTSQGALGTRLHLEALALPKGVRLIVYDPAAPSAGADPVTAEGLSGQSDAWTETVFGERVVLECQVPPGVDPAAVTFSVTGLSHFYRPVSPGVVLQAGECENDVTCYSAWANQAAGTARISFVDSGSTYICTGCLLSDSDPNTIVNYFLTANHCVGNATVASTLELYWFYQTATCNGTPPSLSSVPHTGGGADFLAGSGANDFTFMRLRQSPPANVYYMGWSTASPSGTETLTDVHHPEGDFKRISFGNQVGSDADFWEVQWYSGVTEPGSSGSPLFNANHQVIGQLLGGSSACDNTSGIDEFGRFNVTYGAIRQWIDAVVVPGNDLCGGAVALSDNVYRSQNTAAATDDATPCLGACYKGVWFTFTPSVTGTATVDTCTSDFDTRIEVFLGTCSSLSSIGCNDNGSCSPQSSFSFPCVAGATYRICAGGSEQASGNLKIRAHAQVPPHPPILTVQSAGARSVPVTVSPADRNGLRSGITAFARSYTDGTQVTLAAPSSAGGQAFTGWGGVDSQSATTAVVRMTADRTVTARYGVDSVPWIDLLLGQ